MNGDRLEFLISLMLVLTITAFVLSAPRASSSTDTSVIFRSWQLGIPKGQYPFLRYFEDRGGYVWIFNFPRSTDCSVTHLEVRKFVDKKLFVPVTKPTIGWFILGKNMFQFPEQIPIVRDAASMKVIRNVWTPNYGFYSALIKADQVQWRDNSMPSGTSIPLDMNMFVDMFELMMDICHEKYRLDNSPNELQIGKPKTFASNQE